MNRFETVRQTLLWEQVAKTASAKAAALRQELSADARAELQEQGTAPTWRMPDLGTVSLAVSKETVYVADDKALLEWCKATPGESVVEAVERVMPWYVADLISMSRVVDGQVVVDNEVVPGLAVRPGGIPGALTFRPNHDAKTILAGLAEQIVESIADPFIAPEVPSGD